MSGTKEKMAEMETKMADLERKNRELTLRNQKLVEESAAHDSLSERMKNQYENLGGLSADEVRELYGMLRNKELEKEREMEKQRRIEELTHELKELGIAVDPAGHNIKQEELVADHDVSSDQGVARSQKIDYSWVLPCENRFQFRRWANTFESLVNTNLKFVDAAMKDDVIDAALQVAFTKGKFFSGLDDLEIYSKQGYSGIGLLEHLRAKYNMVQGKELALNESKLKSIKRDKGERLFDAIQRFCRMKAKVDVLLPVGEALSDRDSRQLFRRILYDSEFKEALHECKDLARDEPSYLLSGEGIDKYTYDCWLAAAETVALTQETSMPVQSTHKAMRADGSGGRGGHSNAEGQVTRDGGCYVCGLKGHFAARCPERKDRIGQQPKASDSQALKADSSRGRGSNRGRGRGRGRGRHKSEGFKGSQPSPQQ